MFDNRSMNRLKEAFDAVDERRRAALNEAIQQLDDVLGEQPQEVTDAVERFITSMWGVL